MTIRTFSAFFLVLIIALISCSTAAPAGFWSNFSSNKLVKNIYDEGPWGGYRAMLWRTNKREPFIPKAILSFATAKGWTLSDSSTYTQSQTEKWKYFGKPIFPLTYSGFFDTSTNDDEVSHFPRWFEGRILVYKFKTGWITVSHGTDSSIEENGFILLNEDMTEMAVYHLWGE